MDPTVQVIICVLIGLLTGLMSALCGVGGGIIMVPAFVFFLKMDQKTAVATSLAAIIMTSLAGSARNHTGNLIDWRVTIPTGLAAAAVAWFAAGWMRSLSSPVLTRIFAIFVIVMGLQMLWSSTRAPKSASPAATPVESETK